MVLFKISMFCHVWCEQGMEEDGVRPTEKFYMALLRATGEGNRTDKTIHILQEMREAGLTPGVRSYNCAVGACGKVIVSSPCRPIPRVGVGQDIHAAFVDPFVALNLFDTAGRRWTRFPCCYGGLFCRKSCCAYCGSIIGGYSVPRLRSPSVGVKCWCSSRNGVHFRRCTSDAMH